jgi:hypothetical protein
MLRDYRRLTTLVRGRHGEDYADAETWWGQNLLSYYYTWLLFVGHGAHTPTTRGGRLLVLVLGGFFLIVVAAYTANLAAFLVLEAAKMQPVRDLSHLAEQGLKACVRDVDVTLINNWFPNVETMSFRSDTGQVNAFVAKKCGGMIVNGIVMQNEIDAKKIHCDKAMAGTSLIPYAAGWVTNFESECVMVPHPAHV